MAAGAGDGDAEAEAAEGSGDDRGGSAAFENDGGCDVLAVGAALKEMSHATEITLAFFAYIGTEEDGDGRHDAGVTKGGGDAKERGEASAVIADAGSLDAGAVG